MTEPIVLGVSSTRGRAQAVEVRPGFELLGRYLETDIRGRGLLYRDVRALLEEGLRGGEGDEIVSDAHALSVEGPETTITLTYNDAHTATYSTQDVLQALDEYAEHLAERERSRDSAT